jgi:DNA-directed RNA polymerase specialized sigma24 family protein
MGGAVGMNFMTPMSMESANKGVEAELDRLTYSAYLLTLDPGLAMSLVMTAVEDAQEDASSPANLLRRTVELSLQQLRRENTWRLDRESSALEALLYGDVTAVESMRVLSFQEKINGNPIVLLDYAARITFVLHHVLDYQITEAAAMLEMTEKKYRAHLRTAYLQLASLHVASRAPASGVVGAARA